MIYIVYIYIYVYYIKCRTSALASSSLPRTESASVILVYEALSYQCAGVRGLKLLVYDALRY